jgi:hypothetical protein
MDPEKSELFFLLLKLKSYLVSMIDNSEDAGKDFYYTEEYLERRFPEKKEEIMERLVTNGINSDREIAFNEKIVFEFKKMVSFGEENTDLTSLLRKFEIEAVGIERENRERESYISERDKELNEILSNIFQLATNWALHRELENKVDDYSALSNEELIRPEEEKRYDALGKSTSVSFENISKLTEKYIYLLTDYYLKYGGDLTLIEFVAELDRVKAMVFKKYSDMFRKHGLDKG